MPAILRSTCLHGPEAGFDLLQTAALLVSQQQSDAFRAAKYQTPIRFGHHVSAPCILACVSHRMGDQRGHSTLLQHILQYKVCNM